MVPSMCYHVLSEFLCLLWVRPEQGSWMVDEMTTRVDGDGCGRQVAGRVSAPLPGIFAGIVLSNLPLAPIDIMGNDSQYVGSA